MKKLFLASALIWSVFTQANEVNRWNDVAQDAIRTARTQGSQSARALAMVHLAMFEAANSIGQRYNSYLGDTAVVDGLADEVAVAAAARKTLTSIFPTQKYRFIETFKPIEQKYSKHPKYTASVVLGESLAAEIIALRQGDAKLVISEEFFAEYVPGRWVPTMPSYENPSLPKWGQAKPFVLASGSAYRRPPPPALDSPEYLKDLREVFEIGGKVSQTRSEDQTQIARFWSDGPGTSSTAGHYDQLARKLAANYDLLDTAHLLAVLNTAMADAGIACWDTKYTYWLWRPVTAIRDTKMDAQWEPLLNTPAFPEYVSGHSTVSGVARAVLEKEFGKSAHFTLESDGLPGISRSYSSIQQATFEAGRSRIFGGIHFEFSNVAAHEMGMQIGQFISQTFLLKHP